jgi:hypothetical protein
MAEYGSAGNNVVSLRKQARGVMGTETAEERELVRQCQVRIQRAETDRNRHKGRISDINKYAMPWRHKFDANQPSGSQDDEIFDTTAMTVLEDFAADMQNTFTPMKSSWVESKPVKKLDAGDMGIIKDALKQYDDILFSEMRRSNLYQALQEGYHDLGAGTMALSINDINIAEPIHCEAIPSTELLLDRGLYGKIDGMWRKWPKKRGEEIGVQWPMAKAPLPGKLEVGDVDEYDVIDGVYRDWSTPAVERWCYVVMLSGRLAHTEHFTGLGSNQMIVARWLRDSTTAWGVGPTYLVTPAIKTLNYLQEKELNAVDRAVDPVCSYEDDGVMNLEQGVEPGLWIARAVGSDAPQVIESRSQFDVSFAKREDLVHEIKRAHYQDRPEQTGKTPPTATQWADEAAERARRMGTPATNLVHELQYAIVRRFAYLLNRRGVLPKIELNGAEIALEPVSPLLRAQEQEEVVRVQRWLESMAGIYGPQTVLVISKPAEVSTYLADKLGVPAYLANGTAEIQAAMAQFAPLIQQTTGGGGIPAEAPQPVP